DYIEDCDSYDQSSWTYFCENNCIKKKRKDYYCSSGGCSYTWQTEVLSCKGDGDYCADRNSYQEACGKCGYGDYDCDADYECAAAAPDCVDTNGDACGLGAECGCCGWGDTWSETLNQCCEDEDHTGCIGNEVYWYDSCNQLQEQVEDCDDQDGDWEYYCTDDCIKKKYKNYYCTGGACTYDWVYQTVSCKGDEDYCGHREDHQEACGKCGYEDWDCDDYVIDECASGLDCKGTYLDTPGDPSTYDGCCDPDETYDQSTHECCTKHDHYGCDGDDIYWVDSCGQQNDHVQDCSELDTDWEFYCEGDCLDKKYKDYTCTGGACTYSWHEEEESCRGDGDYCAKRDDHQEACGKCEYDDFDCDADYECAASAPDCADANGGACGLGAECGCCYTGDYWSESQDMCCTAEDHKGCVGNDVYWYDRCGAQGQLVEDCDDSDGEEYFCQDDCIKKSILDYSCIGEGECVSASAPILISCDGDASYCSDRSAHPEACGTCDHGQYECELDSHCDWDLDCVDIDNECQAANECGCCYPGEIWLEATDLCYMPPDCGDNICEPGEYCPEDCIELNGFISPPSEVAAGEEVTLNIEVHNTGDQIMSIFVEASIVPEYWADYGLIPDDGKGVHWYPPGCCPENEYYNTSVVGLSAGETYSFPLTINAPTEESMDGCGNLSAWGPEFKLLAGLYIECQGGYSDYVMHDIAVHESEECNYNDICDPGETPENCRDDCPCLINGACEPEWETPENCRDDCRCNHDDVCDPQWEDINNCPDDCAAGCDIPDGSTWYCDCDSDADCIPHGDYYCNQVSGPDACEEISWQDECSNHNDYFCEYGWVKQCIDAGTHWVKEYIENCNGLYEYCDPTVVDGTGSCSVYDHDIWIDHADTGVRVNKQPGDKMRLNIYSATAGTVDVDFFTGAFSGYCYGSWSIGQGITTCDMLVDELAENGDYELTVDNKIAHVTITDQPEFLIVTDSEKLYERFPHEDNGVRAVLKQAYVNAKEDGVVYDLSWYEEDIGIAGLFESLAEYHEELTLPHEMDNSYQEAVADFIKEMCDDCMDVMIVGDDFVVPYYRNPITVDYNWFPWLHDQVQHNIYTDQHFIQVKGAPPIKELDKIFTADGHADKQVMFILPDDVSPDMRESIDTLKLVIETKFHTDDIPEKAGSELILGDYGVPGTTLVIIGTADNNPALRYYPFAIANDYDMYIDRNLWDPNRAFMQSEEYALIMVIDSAFLLDLNSGAIWSEMYKEVEGEAINWWMMAGGAALVIVSPFTGPAAPFVAVAGIAILSADTVDNCLIENQAGQNWDECSVDIIIDIATVGIFKVVGKYAKPLTERFGKEATEQIITRLIKLGKYINPKALAAVAKQGDELLNLKLISRGVKSAAGESDEILERFVKNMPNSMDDMAKNGFFRDLGKIAENYGDDIADDLVQLGDVPGVDRLTKNVVVGQEGFKFEARSARILKDKGIKELSKKIDNGEIDMLMKNYDVWDAKQGWGTLTRNNPQWGDITDGWNTQISKYKQFISNSPNPSGKVHFVFDSHVSDDVMEFLLEKGVKVKKIINGEVLNG
ncbi:MAG: hypothetical protein KJ709_05290, partial [Nanoarchaeota archaeon]|nr:hypothetical protein [Nanoarchaeota archaeon]